MVEVLNRIPVLSRTFAKLRLDMFLQKSCYQLRMGGRFPRRNGFSVAATALVLAVAYCFGDKSLDVCVGIR